jgi:hypothetical protein
MAGLLKNQQQLKKLQGMDTLTARQQNRLGYLEKQAAKPGALTKKAQNRQQFAAREGLNRAQSKALGQQEKADVQLGKMANQMLPSVQDAYAQPFDFDALPSQVTGQDFERWRNEQIDQAYQTYSSRMDPQFAQARQDFEQQMANRGIPVGSPLYNSQLQELERGQSDSRQSALTNAQGIAGQNAGQFFDIGQSARGQALQEGLLARGMPLAEFQALYGAQSGMVPQNLAYNQELGMAQKNFELARQMPRGGGGGGGAAWEQYGFSSPQAYDAYQTQMERDNFLWAQQNTPKQKQPSPWAGLAGQAIGAGLQGWGASGFEKFW